MGNEGSHSTEEVGQGEGTIENDLQVSWRKVCAENPSLGRDGHCACACDGRTYVFGGVVETADEGHVESNDLLMFDPDSDSWRVVVICGDLPPARSSASMASVGSKLYLFGGLSQAGGWMAGCYMFDTETNVWSELTATGHNGPSPRDKLATAVVSQNIYVFGGFGPVTAKQEEEGDGEDEEEEAEEEANDGLDDVQEAAKFGWFDQLFAFDTVSRSWSQPMHLNKGGPSPRAAHTMCSVSQRLIIFGGRDSVARKNDLYVYDTETRKWAKDLPIKGRRPEPRSFHAACSLGQKVIVVGGRGVNNEHYNDVHILDTVDWRWLQPSCTGDVLPPRGVHTATAVGNRLVVFGGSSDFDAETMQCSSYLGDTYVLDLADLIKEKISIDEVEEVTKTNDETTATASSANSDHTAAPPHAAEHDKSRIGPSSDTIFGAS